MKGKVLIGRGLHLCPLRKTLRQTSVTGKVGVLKKIRPFYHALTENGKCRNGVQMEAGFETPNGPESQRQKVEEKGALCFGGQRYHLPLGIGVGLVIDVLKIGRLAAQAGAVEDNLAIDLAGGVINKRHACSPG